MKTLAQARDKAEIRERMRQVRPDSARRWGRMSAHQMVCHLGDCLRMALGQKGGIHKPGLLKRTVFKWVALYAPLRWPRGILTTPELDQDVGGTRPAEFAADMVEVEGLLELLSQRAGSLGGTRHPIFGTMSDADWLRWGYLHMDHHLRQFGV
jgi:hypothetical protein